MKFEMEKKGIVALSLMLAGPLAAHAELATAADVPSTMIAQAPGRVVAKPGGAAAVTRAPGGAAAPAGSKSVWVKRSGAQLRSSAAATSSVVATLNEGDQLSVLATEGNKYKVRGGAGEGYIATMVVSDAAPAKKGGGALGTRNDVVLSQNSNISSTRGLGPDAEKYAEAAEITPQAKADVEKMKDISLAITDVDLELFQEEGEASAK